MLVVAVEPLGKKKKKICFENHLTLALYPKEIAQFAIEAGEDFPENQYEKLLAEVLVPRARKRTLYLLERMDRTEYQLRRKLQEDFYPEPVIENAIAYADRLHYIDDERYVQNYLDSQLKRKSLRQVCMELEQKGAGREKIQQAIEQRPVDEAETICRLAKKRMGEQPEEKDILKAKQYLFRKGFSYDAIERGVNRLLAEAQ